MPYVGPEVIPKASMVLSQGSLSTSSQIINVPGGYTVGNIEVVINGVELQTGEYTATDGTTIDLGEAFPAGTDYKVKEYRSFNVANHYTKSESDGRYAQLSGANDFVSMPSVGGDPIVESGSNTDGEWTRWADGTQICRALATYDGITNTAGSLYKSNIESWIFPSAFTGTINEIACAGADVSATTIWVTSRADTSTLAFFQAHFPSSLSGTRTAVLSAIGLWK